MAVRMDLHCHSKYSTTPPGWLLRTIGCPESFTEPMDLYQLALRREMTAVTITDHNTIDGCLEIGHLDHTFVSCEYTVYFPEDRTAVHVLAYDITEEQHRDLNKARENIYEFLDHVQSYGIWHACAHPLQGIEDHVTLACIEKLVLLFKNWEVNGSLCPQLNGAVMAALKALSPSLVNQLSDRHAIVPIFPEPWKKALVAGSDDHSSLTVAQSFTEVPDADTLGAFWLGVEHGQATVVLHEATPHTFARNIYSTAYEFATRDEDPIYVKNDGVVGQFLDNVLRPWRGTREPVSIHKLDLPPRRGHSSSLLFASSMLTSLRIEAESLIQGEPELMALTAESSSSNSEMSPIWYKFMSLLSNRVLADLGREIVEDLSARRLVAVLPSLGAVATLHAMLIPYLTGFTAAARQRHLGALVLRYFTREGGDQETSAKRQERVATFTDTFHEVNGITSILRQQLSVARELGKDFTVIACTENSVCSEERVKRFEPLAVLDLPEYPELKVVLPPFLDMLDMVYKEGFTHIHAATPGPVGIAALAIARILGLPICATYHTALPQYARHLTGDTQVEAFARHFVNWFYGLVDTVYVPSHAIANDIIGHGVSPEKVHAYAEGIDVERFHPGKRAHFAHSEAPALPEGNGTLTLLYVGRVSKEKNLDVLCCAFKALLEKSHDIRLCVAGDGPYRGEMETVLAGTPTIFTGNLQGDELSAVYATSSMLVFPSATDTMGTVVLEAQASGIPVIVTDQGGPQENVIPEETGLIVPANDVDALVAAVEVLLADEKRRSAMGAAARRYMEERQFKDRFREIWALYVGNGQGGE